MTKSHANGHEPDPAARNVREATTAGEGDGPGAPREAAPSAAAIRVSLAMTTPVEGIEAVTVEPTPAPLVMLEASSGTGLLGGLAVESGRALPAHPPGILVDGAPGEVGLRRIDAEHATVRDEAGSQRSVLLPAPAATRPGPALLDRREVVVDGWRLEVEIEPAARAALRARARRGGAEAGHAGPTEVRAIIPGVVVGVSVSQGDEVVAGQQLLAVEAMKMQNELRAPRDGTVERVAVAMGQTLEVGDLLLVIS